VSRFLFVAPPFAAHFVPLVSVGRELALRGHAVAWVSYAKVRALLPAESTFFAVAEGDLYGRIMEDDKPHPPRFLAAEFVQFYRDIVAPMTEAMLPDVEAAVAQFRPDVVVADQHALAGAIAARRHGLPWATSAPTGFLQSTALDKHEAAKKWLHELLANAQRDAGLPVVERPDVSPHLVLLYTSQMLAGTQMRFPAHYRFVGPALDHRVEPDDFPWHELVAKPRVMVSLGSVVAERGRRFLATVVAALRDEDLQVVVSAPEGVLREAPPNFLVRSWLPQVQLLPRMNAAISHGGSTANDTLAFGVPLVLAPIWTDNFVTAQKIVDAGAGIRVKYGRVGAEELRRAVHDVLERPAFRQAAQAIQASFVAAGGTRAAADQVESLSSRAAAQQ
jgi:MGT family glycosyltransferase